MATKDLNIFGISERSSSQARAKGECPLLMEAATPDIYRRNAFRITGLEVDAKPREITRHVQELEIMADLGDPESSSKHCFAIKADQDQIKEALERLKNPKTRLIDEFFWLWPMEFGKSKEDKGLNYLKEGKLKDARNFWLEELNCVDSSHSKQKKISAKHNIAVLFHLVALDWETKYRVKSNLKKEQSDSVDSYWKQAFKNWDDIITDDQFWAIIESRIFDIDDPSLKIDFVEDFRNSLPEAFDKINGELALQFAEKGRMDLAKWHIAFMKETNQGLDNVEKTSELVLTPAKERIRHFIKDAENKSKRDVRSGDIVGSELLAKSKPILELFDLFFGSGSASQDDIYDEIAESARCITIAYMNKTEDYQGSVKILKDILAVAKSIRLRQKLQKDINVGKDNEHFVQIKPILDELQKIEQSSNDYNAKLANIKFRVIFSLDELGEEIKHTELFNQLKDSLAIVLRSISVGAFNSYAAMPYSKDLIATSAEAISLALQYANDRALKNKIKADYDFVMPLASKWGIRIPKHTNLPLRLSVHKKREEPISKDTNIPPYEPVGDPKVKQNLSHTHKSKKIGEMTGVFIAVVIAALILLAIWLMT